MKKIKTLLITFIFSMTGCSNIIESLSNKNSDDALYEAGVMAMNRSDWDTAITKFTSLQSTYFSSEEKKLMIASAYAGKCGLNFMSYAVNLGSISLTGTTLFKYFMNQWTGITVYTSYCATAEQWINAIGTSAQRSNVANFNMMILGMVKVGVFLRDNADIDGVGGLGDGTADGGYSSCTNAVAGTGITDAKVDEVVSGFANFLVNASANLSSLSSDVQTAVTALTTFCSTLTVNPCGMTDSSTVTSGARDAMRDLLKTLAVGIESCVNGDPNTCC